MIEWYWVIAVGVGSFILGVAVATYHWSRNFNIYYR